MLDTNHTVEVPEGIEINLPIAGPVARSVAFLIDFLIRAVIITIASSVLSFFGLMGKGLLLILIFLLEWFYPILFEVLNQGATIGKKVMGLAVVHDDGTPVSWSSSMTRNLMRTADMFPGFYLTGLISMFVSPQFKRLGDMTAGTLVIHKKKFANKAVLPEAKGLQPYFPLNLEEQRAIIHFGERSSQLSQSRCYELSDLLKGSLKAENSSDRMQSILSMANWLRGRR